MTAIIGAQGGGWALSGLQLGVNEIAASLIIAKSVGSIFSRRSDATIFDALEQHLGVRVRTTLPTWLNEVEFRRQVCVYAGNLRPIPGVGVMEDVSIGQLQGLATLAVLCARYTESKQNIIGLLEDLVAGRLGDCVSQGSLESSGLPSTSRTLLRNFVQASLDSDADSRQCRKAKEWMAELVVRGNVSWQPVYLGERGSAAVRDILSLLFGGPCSSGSETKEAGESATGRSRHAVGAVYHETLHITAAYATLAAAANGVDAVVECITSEGSFQVPTTTRVRQTTFVTRLWLIQPPSSIQGLLQQPKDRISGYDMETTMNPASAVIFGGVAEIYKSIAGLLGLRSGPGDDEFSDTLRKLWDAGIDLARKCSWTVDDVRYGIVKGAAGGSLPQQRGKELIFRLDAQNLSQEIAPAAVRLATELKKVDHGCGEIARPIATAVDEVWRLRSYDDLFDVSFVDTDLGAAMLFVASSMAVEALRMMTTVSGGSLDQFALSTSAIGPLRMNSLTLFIIQALSRAGCGTNDLLVAAAAVWGGMSKITRPTSAMDSQGLSNGHIGIVGPHSTVVLSILKDPWTLVRQGFKGQILHVCHGSVPLLPQDPVTGAIWGKATLEMGEETRRGNLKLPERDELKFERPESDIIISFEPSETDTSAGVFCCWFGGSFVCEVDPDRVLYNLLRHPVHSPQTAATSKDCQIGAKAFEPLVQDGKVRLISPSSLLRYKNFGDNFLSTSGLFDCHNYVGWAICISGCSPKGSVRFVREHVDSEAAKAILELVGEKNVVVLFNPDHS